MDLATAGVGGASVLPQTIASNTAVTGSAVDMQLSDGPVHAVVITGDAGDATTTLTVKLTESATSGGSYTDITGATLTKAGSATANDNLVYFIDTNQRTLRWVKAVVTTAAGSSISVPIAVAVLGRKKISGTGSGNVL